jgi:FkbM family methyltransferase
MLIDFRQLFPKYGIRPTGVLHVGANVGEEAPVYLELGIKKQIWIEANPIICDRLRRNVSNNPEAIVYEACIGDEAGKVVTFHVSNNGSQSSSILELGTHKEAHPEVHYVEEVKMTMQRLDHILIDVPNVEAYNFLNIDLQGAELLALKGMGDMLLNFQWAYLEVNQRELYKGCALVEDLDYYLGAFGFDRVETMWCGNTGWGDALYIKNEN